MIAHKPKIGTTATSGRVKEEERNVHVTAFMYAASREVDNDFHLIAVVDESLFFDMTHAKGSRPGPPSLKSRMPVIWEVHPISKIEFK
jgi:hypothetical protein